jgi:zinc metalloprotease ZmpB
MRKAILALVVPAAILTLAATTAGGRTQANATGSVFMPNPVQSTGDESLTDQKDSDAAVPASAYYTVPLTNLDGSGYLHGDFATVVSETGNPAYSATGTFTYTRHQDEFEQVMGYFWITEAEKYLQSLGFGSKYPAINNGPYRVRIDQFGADNSFTTDHPRPEIRLGKGGVDDAEDGEVILHEYGHAIHFGQGFSFASEEAGAISEGFGDYWALSVADVVSRSFGVTAKTPLPCLMDWDSTSYTSRVPHCIRRTDLDLHYPQDLSGEVHHDGQIWSRALWDIRQGLGNVKADTIIVNGSFNFPGTTMTDLANRTVAAAQRIYGKSAAAVVRKAFADRGILS